MAAKLRRVFRLVGVFFAARKNSPTAVPAKVLRAWRGEEKGEAGGDAALTWLTFLALRPKIE